MKPTVNIHDLVSLFEPKGHQDLRDTYPELNEYDEFKGLTASEIRMTWMIGSKSSPVRRRVKDKKNVVKEAVNSVFTETQVQRSDNLKKLLKGVHVPAVYANAIKRWGMFNISLRLRSYFMAQTQFDIFEAFSFIPEEEFEKLQPGALKEWMSNTKMANDQLPALIRIIEGGYGLTVRAELTSEESNDFEVKVSIDDVE